MGNQVFKRRAVEILLALLIITGAFFVLSAVFGFGGNLLSPSNTPVNTEQDALREGLLGNPEEVEVVPPLNYDPDPVPEDQREYPAARIVELNNLDPITLQEAQENLELQRELERQRAVLLAALNIENNEPDGQYVLQLLDKLGSVNARSFLVGDLDTGEVIFERKAHNAYPIASITKFFTAYAAVEMLEPNEIATIDYSKLAVEGNRAQFIPGDTLTIRELLYPLLLVSSNDAGEILAQQRDRNAFIARMNEIASREALHHTSFEDPTGLSQNNISTARDLFQFMRIVRTTYPQIVGISQLSTKSINEYTWYNINRASRFPEFRGGKTGFTNAALQTSIGFYEIQLSNGQMKNIGVVILQSHTRQQDTRNLLDYLKNHVAWRPHPVETEE